MISYSYNGCPLTQNSINNKRNSLNDACLDTSVYIMNGIFIFNLRVDYWVQILIGHSMCEGLELLRDETLLLTSNDNNSKHC